MNVSDRGRKYDFHVARKFYDPIKSDLFSWVVYVTDVTTGDIVITFNKADIAELFEITGGQL